MAPACGFVPRPPLGGVAVLIPDAPEQERKGTYGSGPRERGDPALRTSCHLGLESGLVGQLPKSKAFRFMCWSRPSRPDRMALR